MAKNTAHNAKPRQAVNRSPTQQNLIIQQAIDLAVQQDIANRLPEAKSIYRQVLQAGPNQPVLLNFLGVIAHQAGKSDIAVDLFTRALAIKPKFADAHIDLGNALKGLGKLNEAVTSYRESLRIKPDNAEAHRQLGVVLQDLGQLDEAVEHYKVALSQHSDYAGVLGQSIWEIEQMFGMHGDYSSEAGQDKFIGETLFKGKTNGIFVEIGGYDGVTGSNTLFFEKFRQWKGICIEPNPSLFERMTRFRTVECLNVAISNYEGENSFLEITKSLYQMGGLMEDLRPGFLKQLKENKENACREIHVPVTTFSAIAKERNLRYLDYCSIDAEGGELKILRGIDFDFTDITVISVENPQHLLDNCKLIREFMDERGYRLAATMGADDIFKKIRGGPN